MDNDQSPEKEILPESPREVQIVDAKPVPEPSSRERRGNVIIGTLNVFNAPVQRYIGEPLRQRYDRHYHPRHTHGTKHLIADIFLVVGVLALLSANIYAYLVTRTPGLRAQVSLSLSLTPKPLISGEETTITLAYANTNDVPLTDARLAVLLPGHTHPLTTDVSDVYDEKTHTFSLGTIAANANGRVAITWPLLGAVGSTVDFSAALSYGSEQSRRRESKGVSMQERIVDATVHGAVTLPPRVVHEGVFPFTIEYANTGKRALDSVVLHPVLGAHFHIETSSLPLRDGVFALGLLASGARGTIDGTVQYMGSGEEQAEFLVEFYAGEARVLQREERQTVPVYYSKVHLFGLRDAQPLDPGSDAVITVQYENGEASDLLDLALELRAPDTVFDFSDASSMTRSKINNTALALIRAGAKGDIIFTVPIKKVIDRAAAFGDGDPVVHLPLMVSYRLADAPQHLIQIEKEITRTMNTDLEIDAFARYYTAEGDQLGRGPLPPRVLETTKYWIFLPLTNTISDVTDVVVTATLGEAVSWSKKSSVTLGEPLVYDARNRTVTWKIARVTRFSGGIYPDVGAAFEIGITPDAHVIGTEPVLVFDIHVGGKDTLSGVVLERSAAPVTTLLAADRRAQGKSRVAP